MAEYHLTAYGVAAISIVGSLYALKLSRHRRNLRIIDEDPVLNQEEKYFMKTRQRVFAYSPCPLDIMLTIKSNKKAHGMAKRSAESQGSLTSEKGGLCDILEAAALM